MKPRAVLLRSLCAALVFGIAVGLAGCAPEPDIEQSRAEIAPVLADFREYLDSTWQEGDSGRADDLALEWCRVPGESKSTTKRYAVTWTLQSQVAGAELADAFAGIAEEHGFTLATELEESAEDPTWTATTTLEGTHGAAVTLTITDWEAATNVVLRADTPCAKVS